MPQPSPTNSTFITNNPPTSSQAEATPVSSEQPAATVDSTKSASYTASNGNSNGNTWTLPLKPSPQNASATANGSYGRGATNGSLPSTYQDARYPYDGARSPVPWFDSSNFPDMQNRGPTASSVSSPVFHAGSNPSSRHHSMRPFPPMMVRISFICLSSVYASKC